jgi:hypothetical protein
MKRQEAYREIGGMVFVSKPLEGLEENQNKIAQKDESDMALNGIEVPSLIVSKSEALFEVFDHLFDLPPLGVVPDHIDRRQVKIGADQIDGFFTFFFHDHDSDFPEVFDLTDEPGDVELFVFSIDQNRDLPIRRSERQQGCHLCLLPMNPEVRIGFELRDHMITTRSTHPDQGFGPVPTVSQNIEPTRNGESKSLKNLFGQRDFRLKGTTSSRALGVIEFGPEG